MRGACALITYMRAMGCVSNRTSYKPELGLEYKTSPLASPKSKPCLRPQIPKYQISARVPKTLLYCIISVSLVVLLKNLRARDGYF